MSGGGTRGAQVGVVVAHRVLDEPGSLAARNDVSVFGDVETTGDPAAEIACMTTERHVGWEKNGTSSESGGRVRAVTHSSGITLVLKAHCRNDGQPGIEGFGTCPL